MSLLVCAPGIDMALCHLGNYLSLHIRWVAQAVSSGLQAGCHSTATTTQRQDE